MQAYKIIHPDGATPSIRKLNRRSEGLARKLLLLSAAVSGLVAGSALADPLPAGGTVAAGSASISLGVQSVTVTQSSARAVINWQQFSVGQGAQVDFRQPNAQAATLNRVSGGVSSQIAGQINSNGAVYLVNPNGILISSTGEVNSAGGFVASTLDIADKDFMAGSLSFAGNGNSAGASNAGHIAAGQGAYVALLGGSVANSGYISVPLGRIGLGSGEQIALDINGGNFMQVAMPNSALTGDEPLVGNSGILVAGGGTVLLKAATVKDAVRNVINMSGSISADSAVSDGGKIFLLSGDGGTVKVSGNLSARATGASGNGGFIETSGKHVDLAGITVNTTAANGSAGTWLIDPSDLKIASSEGDITGSQLSANLGTSNVTIQSGNGSSGTNGDVLVNDAINWSSGNRLTLSAYRNVAVNSAISASGANASLVLQADNTGTGNGTVTIGSGGSANLSGTGSSTRLYYNPASFGTPTDFGSKVTAGKVTAYQLVNTLSNLQAINLFSNTNNYALGRDIDASATSSWNAGAGFAPLFQSAGYAGAFDGQDHVLTDLTINRPTETGVGLFGLLSQTGTIENVVLTGGSTTGHSQVGQLVGQSQGTVLQSSASGNVTGTDSRGSSFSVGGLVGNQSYGVVSRSSATGSVKGTSNVGGLVGSGWSIDHSHATGPVSGSGGNVGGLAGFADSVSESYATGTVSGGGGVGGLAGYAGFIVKSYATGAVSGNGAGGLAGYVSGSVSDSYATGTVIGTSNTGGLVGESDASIIRSYATGAVSGTTSVGGLVGFSLGPDISQSYATGSVTGSSQVGGLVGLIPFGGNISQSYATGMVSASGDYVGGLVGFIRGSGAISDAYASGAVSGRNFVGGLLGWGSPLKCTFCGLQFRFPITRSYATGPVSGDQTVGGLVGYLGFTFSIDQSYAAGAVSGTSQVGGLVGFKFVGGPAGSEFPDSPISNSYWDKTSSGQSVMCGSGTDCDDSHGLTTAQMQDFSTYASTYAGWDFAHVWSPPSQPGQAGQTSGYYPQLYALTPIVVVVPDSVSRTYGAANPEFEGTITSGGPSTYVFGPSGDTLDVSELLTTTATPASNVGRYPIVPDPGATSAAGVAYRVIVPTNSALTIDPAALSITYTANPVTRQVNQPYPAFTGTEVVTGLVNGDTLVGVTSGTAVYAAVGRKHSPGTYAIEGSGLTGSSSNYNYIFVQAHGNATALKIIPGSGCKNQKGKFC